MPAFLSFKISNSNLLSLVLALFPASFIAGNLIINLNIIILILLSAILFKKEIFSIKITILDKLFLLFFLLIILTGFYNDYKFIVNELDWKSRYSTIEKSFSYLRYFLLYFIIRFLVEKDKLNLDFFFISCLVCTLFVSFDIFYQLIVGKDIFGFIAPFRKLSGPFGDELIAGSFLQRFSIFSFFTLMLFNNVDKRFLNFYLIFLFIVFLVAIILSGNRMPFILFILTILTILFFYKKTRKYLVSMLVILGIIFTIIYNLSSKVNSNFHVFYNQIQNTAIIVKSIFSKEHPKNYVVPQHIKEFATFYHTWRINKYFGGGIKNFRYYCHTREKIDPSSPFHHEKICNMHPHNYYLEILTETGVVGFLIFLLIVIYILKVSFFNQFRISNPMYKDLRLVPFVFLFLFEIFPLKSTGSFFTTGNSTYLFLIIGISIGLLRKDKAIENKL